MNSKGLLSTYISRIEADYPRRLKDQSTEGVENLKHRLTVAGGGQQRRMIKDKKRTLDKVVKYSYQGAFIKKFYADWQPTMEGVREAPPIRALINPNKLKPDYDDKIISVDFEYEFQPGDVFEWCNTKTYWLIYLQDLTELAYFKGDIRRCSYEITWLKEDGSMYKTYAAVQGPVETRLNVIQKQGKVKDIPNHSLTMMIPKNSETLKYFQRYAKFYLSSDPELTPVCWRIEAVDSFSMKGVIQITAVEYYANKDEDFIDDGLVKGQIIMTELAKEVDIITDNNSKELIKGDRFIKPNISYEYKFIGDTVSTWGLDQKGLPLETKKIDDFTISLKWTSSYSGQFILSYGEDCTKTIVVESLF